MNTFSIYSHLPVAVQNWLISLYSYKIERQRYGKGYEERLAILKGSDFWTAEQIRAYKEEQTFRIIEQAYHHCPYYKEKYDAAGVSPSSFTCLEDLEKFPVLTKEDVRANLEGMLADNVDRKTLIHYHTSGSTGKALDFYWTKEGPINYEATCSRYNERFGFSPRDLHLNFTGKIVVPLSQNKPPYWRYKRMQHQYMLNMQHITADKIQDIMDFIAQKHFKRFVGYPSIMNSLAVIAADRSFVLSDSPEFICTSAEKMYDYQRENIARVFPNAVFIQHYGFSEQAGSASMCPKLVYHEDFESGHFELHAPVENDKGVTGTLLATGFVNMGMPFIRYNVGDTATFAREKCTCGRQSQKIVEIEGRNEDYVITPEGAHIMRFDYL